MTDMSFVVLSSLAFFLLGIYCTIYCARWLRGSDNVIMLERELDSLRLALDESNSIIKDYDLLVCDALEASRAFANGDSKRLGELMSKIKGRVQNGNEDGNKTT